MTWAVHLLLLGLLSGCVSEWRTSESVTPSTYQAPSYRAADSIGRLGRLAVMPVEVHLEADDSERSRPEWAERRNRLAHELQLSIATYLSKQKGYDARIIDVPAPLTDATVVREAGQRLRVDGIVVVEQWIRKPWSTAKGILNVFLLNIPLFQALSDLNLRISIYEAASGRLVWQQEMKGEMSEAEARTSTDLARALGDLENAVPPQLRR